MTVPEIDRRLDEIEAIRKVLGQRINELALQLITGKHQGLSLRLFGQLSVVEEARTPRRVNESD